MKNRYRIVNANDGWRYKVQYKPWWWPFWITPIGLNYHNTIAEAERWAEGHAKTEAKYLGHFVQENSEGK